MEIIRKKFARMRKGKWQELDCRNPITLCGEVLSALFNIPSRVRTVWLTLHTDANSRYREPLDVRKDEYGTWPVLYFDVDGDRGTFTRPTLNKALRPYIGKTVWLECWYE